MALIWWEKTVEYFFIRNWVGGSMFVAPLDGDAERAGDTIFSSDNNWILIEFKRNEASLNSERTKFDDFKAAKKAFEMQDMHHFLVYGEMLRTKNKKEEFGIIAKTYFSSCQVNCFNGMLSCGIGIKEFIEYIKLFTSFKKTNKGSSGGLGIETYGLVAGINENNQVVECLSLAEMANHLSIALIPENNPVPESVQSENSPER